MCTWRRPPLAQRATGSDRSSSQIADPSELGAATWPTLRGRSRWPGTVLLGLFLSASGISGLGIVEGHPRQGFFSRRHSGPRRRRSRTARVRRRYDIETSGDRSSEEITPNAVLQQSGRPRGLRGRHSRRRLTRVCRSVWWPSTGGARADCSPTACGADGRDRRLIRRRGRRQRRVWSRRAHVRRRAGLPCRRPRRRPGRQPRSTRGLQPVPACCVEHQFRRHRLGGNELQRRPLALGRLNDTDLCRRRSRRRRVAAPFREADRRGPDGGTTDMCAAMRKFKFRVAFTGTTRRRQYAYG